MLNFTIGFILGFVLWITFAIIVVKTIPSKIEKDMKEINEKLGIITKYVKEIYGANGTEKKPFLEMREAIDNASKCQDTNPDTSHTIFVK